MWRLLSLHPSFATCLLYLVMHVVVLAFFVLLASLGGERGNMNRVGWISLLAGITSFTTLSVRARSVLMLVRLFKSLERILVSQPSFSGSDGKRHLIRMQRISWAMFYFHLLTILTQATIRALAGWNWSPSYTGMSREEMSERLLIAQGVVFQLCIMSASLMATFVFKTILSTLEQHAGIHAAAPAAPPVPDKISNNKATGAAAVQQAPISPLSPRRAVSPTPGSLAVPPPTSPSGARRGSGNGLNHVVQVGPAPISPASPAPAWDVEAASPRSQLPTSADKVSVSPLLPPESATLPAGGGKRSAASVAPLPRHVSEKAPALSSAQSMYADVHGQLQAMNKSSLSGFFIMIVALICVAVPAIRERYTYAD